MSQSERRAAKPRRARRTKAEMQAEREQLEFKKNDVVEDDEDAEKPRRGRPRVNKFKEVETQGNTDVAPTPYQQIYNELQDDMKMLKEKSFEDDMMITNLRNTVSSLKRIRNEYDEKIIKCFFSHCNYSFFPNDLNGNLIFYYLCYYNYITLVSLYLKSKKNFYHNSTFKAISHSFFFLILFSETKITKRNC